MGETQNWISLLLWVPQGRDFDFTIAVHIVLKGAKRLCDWLAKACIQRIE